MNKTKYLQKKNKTMGPLISRLYDTLAAFTHEKPSRILMLGLDAAGKTTILYKVKLNETVQTIPTIGQSSFFEILINNIFFFFLFIGFNVETVTPAPGITFTVWDIGGQSKLRPLYSHYYDKTDGLLFVVDSSDRERLQEARDELFGIITDESMSTVPVVIIANKSDLSTAVKPSELIGQLSLHSFPRRRWYIQSTCAITGEGIVEGMQQLAKMIKDKRKSSH